jgi:hypothetical protein
MNVEKEYSAGEEALFLELLTSVCKRPRMYTLEGSFTEVCAYLTGYEAGLKQYQSERNSVWYGFGNWILKKFRQPSNYVFWSVLRRKYPDDQMALEQLPILYSDYLEWKKKNQKKDRKATVRTAVADQEANTA